MSTEGSAAEGYLPLGVRVAGLRVVVVGGGRVGSRKARTLLEAGAWVTVVSPQIDEGLERLLHRERLIWLEEGYTTEHIRHADFVVAATPDRSLNRQIGRDAEEARILYCLASPGRESRVIFPATHEEGPVTIAVHTNGAECTQSRWLRDRLATVLRSEGLPPRIVAFGVDRRSLRPEQFEALRQVESALKPDDFDAGEVLILSTCQRWEVYFISAAPRTFRARILSLIETNGGPRLAHNLQTLDSRYDTRAVHHLLEVASGLDSPLRGESEIVGQLRSAAEKWLPTDGPLRHLICWCLSAHKRVRDAAPALEGRSWSSVVVAALERLTAEVAEPSVAVIGCGRLSEALARKLSPKAELVPFSRRGPDDVPWCKEFGVRVRLRTELPGALRSVDAVVIASDGPDWWREEVARAARGGLPVLDLSGDHAWHDAGPRCYGLTGVASVPLTLAEAVHLSRAREAAFERAVEWEADRRPTLPLGERVRVACRDSRLSLVQTDWLVGLLRDLAPHVEFATHTFASPGDRDRKTPLPEVTSGDFFTRDLDEALLTGAADIGVHSAKDLPDDLPAGLKVAALTPAFAPWDCVVTRDGQTLSELPEGARIGTSSERRRRQLAHLRADLTAAEIRGNVPDRIAQLDLGHYDALVLAAAGLLRLGLEERIAQILPEAQCPPEPGQGALAVVIREDDLELAKLLEPLDLGDREGLPWA
ncbi:MAG: hydroxymethylbilane synthase [Armatimonadota bacterium]